MFGGAPVTQDYATLIGSDDFLSNASRTVATSKKLISKSAPLFVG